MRRVSSHLSIGFSILAGMGIVALAMVSSTAAAGVVGFNQRYGYGYGYVLNQRRSEVRRLALAHRRAHHRRTAVTITADQSLNAARRSALRRRHQNIALRCLAKAVYFEARSGPREGQFAVATVILNRVEAARFPASVCAVVYQGSSRLNGCQFSFACDGKPDLPKPGRAWARAVAVADQVMSDDRAGGKEALQLVSTATYYHADYVEPRWSKSLTRLTKIGHHIFYAQGRSS